jgi:hypothetical protein
MAGAVRCSWAYGSCCTCTSSPRLCRGGSQQKRRNVLSACTGRFVTLRERVRAKYERRSHCYRFPWVLLGVCSEVPRQAALDARAEVAMSTLKRLLPRVHSQVRRQAALDARAVAAMSTCIRLLPSVQQQVCRQAALDARAVVAVSTLKGLLSSVQPQVRHQVALLAETSVAVLADKRLLSRVQPRCLVRLLLSLVR